ncbi:MAG: hypothetical protein LBO74_12965 [Candidatus Symbiothrix sp.]|jgi:hypothetical protein|nr:hypothetical protein [Candidatus Symbiothrix sp.]
MDLTYSFLQDTEPSEMQLDMLMHEVAEEAQKRREKADENFMQLIDKEIKLAVKRGGLLMKK